MPPIVYAKFLLACIVYPLFAETAILLLFPPGTSLLLMVPLLLFQCAPFLLLSARSSRRRRGVEAELPFVAMLFYVLSHDSFPNLQDAFSKIEELGRGVLPAFCAEAAALRRNLTYSAGREFSIIEDTFEAHPSAQFREFIHGYLAALASGRDVHTFVRVESDRLLGLLVDRWKAFAGLVSSATEVAFILLAIFPIGMQMVAGAFLNGNTALLVLSSVVLLVFATGSLLLWLDYAQPALNDQSYPLPGVLATGGLLFVSVVLYASGFASSVEVSLVGLSASLVFVFCSHRFFKRLRDGENEIARMLHDLAEDARAGMGLPAALTRLKESSDTYPSLGSSISSFVKSLSLGESPREAQKRVSHPSWLVRVSLGLLSASIETGSGYEQMDTLSLAFRKVADARKSIQTSVLPFAVLGASVPVISVVSFWLLSSMQGLSILVPGLSFQGSSLSIGTSILATSLLSGFMVSKAYSLSVRSLVGVPPILLTALVSFLVFGFA